MVQHMGIMGESDIIVLNFITEEKENTRHSQVCLFKAWCADFKSFRGGKKKKKRWKYHGQKI